MHYNINHSAEMPIIYSIYADMSTPVIVFGSTQNWGSGGER